jgi:ubiquinone/menaquinone biosynthesis C-methylase UbiE
MIAVDVSRRSSARAEADQAATTLAFDRLAPDYDALVSGDTFRHQRAQTHAAFREWIRPGVRVLEIGCGTGLDTLFLAGLGARVVACDPSAEMLTRTRRRLATACLGDRIGLLSCGLQHLPQYLDALDRSEGFDAIVSNFGALNCVPSLEALGVLGRRHLRPGGSVVVGLIGRACLWEAVYFTLRGERAKAARRRAANVSLPVAGVEVPTFFHQQRDVASTLGHGFALVSVTGIGVLVPPPYLEPRWQQVPRPIREAVAGVDRVTAGWPLLNQLGDHTLMCWEKSRVMHD